MTAFTIVDLLVVIAILALLISILLPALNRAREQSKAVACAANLRQIGIGVQMYALDYPDRLPYDRWTDPNLKRVVQWHELIHNTLARNPDPNKPPTLHGIFQCPSAALQKGDRHYAPHTRLFSQQTYKLSWVKRPSEVVLMSDAGQYSSGNADYTLYAADQVSSKWYSPFDKDNNDPIKPGVDKDYVYPGGADLRWRHGTGTNAAANFLFADGHVEPFKKGPRPGLFKKNLRADKPRI